MKKFRNKLIVTDLDGTFFNSSRQLVKRNLDAIEYFKENGGLFTIASGREPLTMGSVGPIAATLTNAPAILANGSFTYNFGQKSMHNFMELDYEKATEMLALVRQEFPHIGIRISSNGGYYSPHANAFVKQQLAPAMPALLAGGNYHEAELSDIPHCGWFRVAFNEESDALDALAAYLEPRYSEFFTFCKAEAEIYEFQSIRSTKGLGLDRLRAQLIAEGRADDSLVSYAAGDYGNDLELLRHADVPCCPANAIDSVKSIALVHLCHCDDGCIGDLIERIECGEA